MTLRKIFTNLGLFFLFLSPCVLEAEEFQVKDPITVNGDKVGKKYYGWQW